MFGVYVVCLCLSVLWTLVDGGLPSLDFLLRITISLKLQFGILFFA